MKPIERGNMKNLVAVLALVTFVVGCTEDRVTVFHNNDRVTELERRANLNDQLNVLQNQRLDALEAALALETEARQEGDLNLSQDIANLDEELRDLLAQEEAARIAGDDTLRADLQVEIANRIAGDQANSVALAVSVFAQSLVNVAVQVQLNQLNSKINLANSKISALTVRVNNLESDLNALEAEVAQLAADMAGINASLQAQIDSLSVQQVATQAQLNQQGVQLFKCNSSSSTERIMKINGKFYAVMNRVTTKNIQVVSGSSSTTVTTPDMCETYLGHLELPNAGGQCTPNSGPFKSTKIPGQTITIPSYTTATVKVVDSVKIALDILTDGGYATTDGGPACSFSISGGGTVATNLIPVQ
jgi:hypothetical protein